MSHNTEHNMIIIPEADVLDGSSQDDPGSYSRFGIFSSISLAPLNWASSHSVFMSCMILLVCF